MNSRVVILVGLLAASASHGFGQKPLSPTETAITFYNALRDKRYVEGFKISVYRGAVEGLSPAEIQELEPEFARTFSQIPQKIEPRGEQVTGDTAIVFLKFDGIDILQQVALIKNGGEWLVGDKDSLAVVKSQGTNFFFNARLEANEEEVFDTLSRVVGSQMVFAQHFDGKVSSLEELIRRGALPPELAGGQVSGYKFAMTVNPDQKSFVATAVPAVYGKTGKLSFHADLTGIRAEDRKGKPATDKSPLYRP